MQLAALLGRGAKILMYHGVSDAIFSADDTVALMQRIDRVAQGRSGDFVRYFPVPGMAHCSGGPATDQFDALTPLVRWVEQGEAPAGLPASARGAGNAGGVNNASCPPTGPPTAAARCAPGPACRATRAAAAWMRPTASSAATERRHSPPWP